MTTTAIRKNLHKYVDSIDDSFARVMHAMVQEYISSYQCNTALTANQEKELSKRIQRHKKGESKSFTWQEVRDSLV